MAVKIRIESDNASRPGFKEASDSLQQLSDKAGITANAAKELAKELDKRRYSEFRSEIKRAADEMDGAAGATRRLAEAERRRSAAVTADLRREMEMRKAVAREQQMQVAAEAKQRAVGGKDGQSGGGGIGGLASLAGGGRFAALGNMTGAMGVAGAAIGVAIKAHEEFNAVSAIGAERGIADWVKYKQSVDNAGRSLAEAREVLAHSDWAKALAHVATELRTTYSEMETEGYGGFQKTRGAAVMLARDLGLVNTEWANSFIRAREADQEWNKTIITQRKVADEAAKNASVLDRIGTDRAQRERKNDLDRITSQSELLKLMQEQEQRLLELEKPENAGHSTNEQIRLEAAQRLLELEERRVKLIAEEAAAADRAAKEKVEAQKKALQEQADLDKENNEWRKQALQGEMAVQRERAKLHQEQVEAEAAAFRRTEAFRDTAARNEQARRMQERQQRMDQLAGAGGADTARQFMQQLDPRKIREDIAKSRVAALEGSGALEDMTGAQRLRAIQQERRNAFKDFNRDKIDRGELDQSVSRVADEVMRSQRGGTKLSEEQINFNHQMINAAQKDQQQKEEIFQTLKDQQGQLDAIIGSGKRGRAQRSP